MYSENWKCHGKAQKITIWEMFYLPTEKVKEIKKNFIGIKKDAIKN